MEYKTNYPTLLIAKAKIGKVLYRKTALDNVMKTVVDRIFEGIDAGINESLPQVGRLMVEKVKNKLIASTGRGITYKYAEETIPGFYKVYQVHQASSPEALPAYHTGTLAKNVSYTIDPEHNAVIVGIFSDAVDPQPKRFFAKVLYLPRDESGKRSFFTNVVVTGPGGRQTPVRDYARYLEYGTENMAPRPFFHVSIRGSIKQARNTIRKDMRTNLERRVGVGKLPIYFRIYIRKNINVGA